MSILLCPPAPGTDEWRATLSASKIPPMLGLSPWQSQFALWHEMAGNTDPEPFDDRLNRFGHMAELMLGPWWESDGEGRVLGSHDVTYTNEAGWIATLDWEGEDADGPCIIECKTTSSLDDWADEEGAPAVPAHYEAQTMFQMGVSGIRRTYVVVLGPFHQVETYRVEFNPELWAALEQRARKWMRSLETGEKPDLDDSIATYRTIRKLHPDIERGEEVEVSEASARALVDAKRALDKAEAAYRAHQIVALDVMGNAQKLVCGDQKIADRRNGAHGVSFVVNKKADL